MAEYNLSIEPKLYDMRSKVATLYEEANKLKTELATDKSRLGNQQYLNETALNYYIVIHMIIKSNIHLVVILKYEVG